MRGRLAVTYIFFEILPSFLLGIFVFISILLMFQALRLSEFVLEHGIPLTTIFQIVIYLSVSFLPAILPMSLLFSILLTYTRLSNDSEILAFKTIGLSMNPILFPALVLSLMVAFLSAHTSFEIAPWGNRQFEVLVTDIGSRKVATTFHEGTFSEGFFDLVIYANKVRSNELTDVFIYDERNTESPLTIVAHSGKVEQDPLAPGHRAILKLFNGDIHRTTNTQTKIHFQTYTISLSAPIQQAIKEKTPQSLTLSEIQNLMVHPEDPNYLKILSEWHKRWAIAVVCPIFALLGVGLGTNTNRRSGKSGGFALALGLIIIYWIFYLTGENLALNAKVPVAMGIWIPNFLFALASLYYLKKAW